MPFLHDKPSSLDRMPGIEQSAIEVIDKITIGSNGLHHHAQFRFYEQARDLVNTPIDPFRQMRSLAKTGSHFLCRDQRDHSRPQTDHWSIIGVFWGH